MGLPCYEFRTFYLKFKGFEYQNMKNLLPNSIEPGQIAWMGRLARLYTGGKGLLVSVPAGLGL
jgi:hypothetical protein